LSNMKHILLVLAFTKFRLGALSLILGMLFLILGAVFLILEAPITVFFNHRMNS